ncbi:hemolymph lipopolysaccharide-binding protein-like [Osmia bicornis bicornis]|uniref:hemolymph lipopolysaccharide-binding protein-like n=1 Tax=Osmia bicornis bicornis TaxID=1437191 RepID=UPI001EAF2A74|nr:hemolymph lipopolysaccharide-binding protein-like [Osmia bicornis bicornis]
MSRLSILINCIILCVAFPGTFSMPKKIAVLNINKTDNILIDDTSCPCDRNPLKLYWDKLHTRNVTVHGAACACDLGVHRKPTPEGYVYVPGIGYHRFFTLGETWNWARKRCIDDGAQLAIINSFEESRALMRLVEIYVPVEYADRNDTMFLGLHKLYSNMDFTTVLGDTLGDTGFYSWTTLPGKQEKTAGGDKNCVGILISNGYMVTLDCNKRYGYFCEIPAITPL